MGFFFFIFIMFSLKFVWFDLGSNGIIFLEGVGGVEFTGWVEIWRVVYSKKKFNVTHPVNSKCNMTELSLKKIKKS